MPILFLLSPYLGPAHLTTTADTATMAPFPSLLLIEQVWVCLYLLARGVGVDPNQMSAKKTQVSALILFFALHATSLVQYFWSGISNSLHRHSKMDYWFWYLQTNYINVKQTLISKTEFFISFFKVSMSNFDLYILEKHKCIPLLVLCIPILWGPD